MISLVSVRLNGFLLISTVFFHPSPSGERNIPPLRDTGMQRIGWDVK